MVVVVVLGVAFSLALPTLGGRGREARDAHSLSRTVSMVLEQARIGAISRRRTYRVTLAPTQVTSEWLDPSGNWQTESSTPAPAEARIWSTATTATVPGSVEKNAHSVSFSPTFGIVVDGDSTKVNAFVYIAGASTTAANRQYVVQVIASGAVKVWNKW
jgi:Tfp pilus assembly protein FimT